MTVPATERKAGPFTGNASATTFPFEFKVFAETDVLVLRTQAGADTELTLNSDYSVTLNADQESNPGGFVTYPLSGSPMASNTSLTLLSNVPFDQPTELPAGGDFNPRVIEDALDRLAVQAQQVNERQDRTLQLPASVQDVSVQLPQPEALKVIGWNLAATALENLDAADLATAITYGESKCDPFTGDGATTAFQLSENPTALNNLRVFVAGEVQHPGVDFTWDVGLTITFAVAPANGAKILAFYQRALPGTEGSSDAIAYRHGAVGTVSRSVHDALRAWITPKDFGAVGAGADETSAWNAFQAATGIPFVPAGTYLENGTTHELPGTLGNARSRGVDFEGGFQTHSGAFIQHSKTYDQVAESLLTRFVEFSAEVDNRTALAAVSKPVGLYVKHTQNGGSASNNAYTHSIMAYARNNAVGDNDVIGVSGRAAKENLVGGIGDAAGVWGSAYQNSTQNGGVMALEGSIYQNAVGNPSGDRSGSKWSVSLHLNSDSVGSRATAAVAIDSAGESGGKYGYWNGIIIDKNTFAANGGGGGDSGTVGINCGSWDTSHFPFIGWKVGNASWHIWRGDLDGLMIRANGIAMRTDGLNQACGYRAQANGTGNAYFDLMTGGTFRGHFFWDAPGQSVNIGSVGAHEFRMRVNEVTRARITTTGDFLIHRGSWDGTHGWGFSAGALGYAQGYRSSSTATDGILDLYSDWGASKRNVFRVQADGTVLNWTAAYGAISDARMKRNIADAPNQLAKIKQLKARTYQKLGDTTTETGLVAQEVEAVYPELVGETSDGTKYVKYSLLVPLLLKAVQELSNRP